MEMEEKFFFKTSDGLKLCGILSSPKAQPSKCIVLCHGITVDKEEGGIFTKLSQELNNAGFSVFRFDFRGHGESEGDSIGLTVAGEEKDVEAAVNFLREKGFKEFGLLGTSFGGGSVSLFSSKNPGDVKALVLWNPVIDYSGLLNPTTHWNKKYWGEPAFERAEKFGYTEIGSSKLKIGLKLLNELKNLAPWQGLLEIKIPILFVHGDHDTYVSIEDSVKYSRMIKNSRFEIIKGAGHGFHDSPLIARKANNVTINFFKKTL